MGEEGSKTNAAGDRAGKPANLEIRVAMIGVVAALLGSIAGGIATAYVAQKSQQAALEQARLQVVATSSQAEVAQIRERALKFFLEVQRIQDMLATGASTDQRAAGLDSLRNVSSALMLYGTPRIAFETSRLAALLASSLQRPNIQSNGVIEGELAEWMRAFILEAGQLRGLAIPDTVIHPPKQPGNKN